MDRQERVKDSRIKEIYFRNQTDFWKMEMCIRALAQIAQTVFLQSNVHPSVAILLEDKETTGHCTILSNGEISGSRPHNTKSLHD